MILQNLENRLPNYEKFEEKVLANIRSNYFPLIYQSLYSQLGYERFPDGKFITDQFKKLLVNNNFLGLVNDIYRTRLSEEGLKEISKRLLVINDFDDYQYVLQQFKGCNKARYKGNEIHKNAYSFGTKLMHFYNPEENPILDSVVRDNLNLGEINLELCFEFKKATCCFLKKHHKYLDEFNTSTHVLQELERRYMTRNFPIMEILDMALY
ncbi:hypothetical protein MSSIT_2326 [Methanosarcina siciliae T4/M]|uniref:Uncharacterized protein n=1 Tax=Methanosarcina siciliae T4/M TaxID=1434120 RepID=A0A0E3P5R1_9EURY|nr:hypothetical protein [Methanosarcina siciliae]AKB29045.1 hypothetical protein MSSIT_2326 [Methanosarcina siciliae T4/M]